MLFRNFNISGVELPVAVWFDRSENITNDLLLPIDQFKTLSCLGAFCVAKALDKVNRIVSCVFIVVGALRHKLSRLVLFQLSDMRSPPSVDKKKAPKGLGEYLVVSPGSPCSGESTL